MIQHRCCRRASQDLKQPTGTNQKQCKTYLRRSLCKITLYPGEVPCAAESCSQVKYRGATQHTWSLVLNSEQINMNFLLPPAVLHQQDRPLLKSKFSLSIDRTSKMRNRCQEAFQVIRCQVQRGKWVKMLQKPDSSKTAHA